MDGLLAIHVPFNRISAISGQWESDSERRSSVKTVFSGRHLRFQYIDLQKASNPDL